jgi:hypothetical protein
VGELPQRLRDEVPLGAVHQPGRQVVRAGRGREGRPGAGREHAGLGLQRDLAQLDEAGRDVLGADRVVAHVGLDHDPAHGRVGEAVRHHGGEHPGGEAWLGLPDGGCDEDVHAQVPVGDLGQPGQGRVGRVVGLGEERRTSADPAQPGVVVGVGRDGGVLLADVGAARALHHPVDRAGVGDPGVEQLEVALDVERLDGDHDTLRRWSGTPKVCTAIRFSTG